MSIATLKLRKCAIMFSFDKKYHRTTASIMKSIEEWEMDGVLFGRTKDCFASTKLWVETRDLWKRTIQRLQITQQSIEKCIVGMIRRDWKIVIWIKSLTKGFWHHRDNSTAEMKMDWAHWKNKATWSTNTIEWYTRVVKRPRRPQVS